MTNNPILIKKIEKNNKFVMTYEMKKEINNMINIARQPAFLPLFPTRLLLHLGHLCHSKS